MIDNATIEIEQMEAKDLKAFRESKAIDQGMVCPICEIKRDHKDFVVDHQHKTKGERNGQNGAGMIRGVICFMCNSTEGRMLAKFKRSGLNKDMDFVDYLKNLVKYLEQGTTNLIHPNEKDKEKKLMKRPFNKIKKLHDLKYPRRKPLEYPKSGKATKVIKDLAEEFSVQL